MRMGDTFNRLAVCGVLAAVLSAAAPDAWAVSIIPDLDEAGTFAILALSTNSDTPSIDISSSSGVVGNLGIGPSGSYGKSGGGLVSGKVFLDTGVSTAISGTPGNEGMIVSPFDLSEAIADALQASLDAAADTTTQTVGDITSSLTIASTGSLNVIAANKIDLSGSNALTLSGAASDFFIVNVSGKLDLTGSAEIILSGVDASHVLFNFPGAGDDLGVSASSVARGTFLAPGRDFTVHGVNLFGAIIANDIRLTSGGQVRYTGFAPPRPEPVIPEPSSALFWVMGCLSLGRSLRRRA